MDNPFSKQARTFRRATAAAVMALSMLPTWNCLSAQSFGTASFTAFVASTGAITRSNGVASTKRTTAGAYQVKFVRPLSTCYFSVSVVGNGPSFANATVSANDPTLLFVRTYAGTGGAADAPFNVIILCGP